MGKLVDVSAADAGLPSLTPSTEWRFDATFDNLKTDSGRTVLTQRVLGRGKFVEEEGYEPPRGKIVFEGEAGGSFEGGKWALSEDPNDRKDGLWVWGLFKEPLYPFILLSLDVGAIASLGEELTDQIPAFTANAQMRHVRDKKTGAVELKRSPLTLKKVTVQKADLAGLASFEYVENMSAGSISIGVFE